MNDQEQIDRIISKLRLYMRENPHLRICQALVNILRPTEPCPQIFYCSDAKLESYLDIELLTDD